VSQDDDISLPTRSERLLPGPVGGLSGASGSPIPQPPIPLLIDPYVPF